MNDYMKLINDPLSVSKDCFEKECKFNNINELKEIINQSNSFGFTKLVENLVMKPQVYLRIPCLNDVSNENISMNSLVRYRCLVQDMYDNEYFVGAMVNNNMKTYWGKYRDYIPNDMNDNQDEWNNCAQIPMQRLVIKCVAAPGENEWVKNMLNTSTILDVASRTPSPEKNKKKRHRNNNNNNNNNQMNEDIITGQNISFNQNNIYII